MHFTQAKWTFLEGASFAGLVSAGLGPQPIAACFLIPAAYLTLTPTHLTLLLQAPKRLPRLPLVCPTGGLPSSPAASVSPDSRSPSLGTHPLSFGFANSSFWGRNTPSPPRGETFCPSSRHPGQLVQAFNKANTILLRPALFPGDWLR